MTKSILTGRKIRQISSNPLLLMLHFSATIRTILSLVGFGLSVALRVSSGKTLSAVKCLKELLKEYPRAIVCSNLQVHGIEQEIIPFTDYQQLQTLTNGIYGVIFLIDELHVLWNSLESKNIPISEMAVFCQMRKDRRIILGTSQVYSRIAKPIREQLKYVILCQNYLKYIQCNTVVDPNADGYSGEHDGNLEGEVIKRSWFFHSPSDYQSYDTLNKIERIARKVEKK